ncbi:MAG: hypothetical protein ACOZFS_01725 [Thermodesulfobacteriota bacterium]
MEKNTEYTLKELCTRQAGLIQELEQRRTEAEKYRKSYKTMSWIVIFTIIFLAVLKFNNYEITVDPYSNKVIAISSTCWGIKKVYREIKWVKTNEYELPAWMTKDKEGKWYPYIFEDTHESQLIDP